MPFEGIFFRKYEKKIDSATNGTHVQPRMTERHDVVSCTYMCTSTTSQVGRVVCRKDVRHIIMSSLGLTKKVYSFVQQSSV